LKNLRDALSHALLILITLPSRVPRPIPEAKMADPTSRLQSLARAVDDAARERDSVIRPPDEVLSRSCRARDDYTGELRGASFRILRRIERASYSKRAEAKAWGNLESAREQVRILEQVGRDLRLESELLEAHAMVERFEMIVEEYSLKRFALADAKKSGRLKRHPVTDGHIHTGKFELIDGVRVPIVEEIRGGNRMSFPDFILSRRCGTAHLGRSDFLADAKSWISAGIFPSISQWADFYKFLTRQNASDETIQSARKLWRDYKKAVSNV
jgi:hypothetical protein